MVAEESWHQDNYLWNKPNSPIPRPIESHLKLRNRINPAGHSDQAGFAKG